MDKKTIYLCGPIDMVPPEWATEWRKEASFYLSSKYNIIDPTEGKDLSAPGIHTTVYSPAEIVLRDYDGVMESDYLLVDLREIPFMERLKNFIRTGHSDPPRTGTTMELAWAIWHKVVAFGDWNYLGYFMRFHVDHRFDDLHDAIAYLLVLARKGEGE